MRVADIFKHLEFLETNIPHFFVSRPDNLNSEPLLFLISQVQQRGNVFKWVRIVSLILVEGIILRMFLKVKASVKLGQFHLLETRGFQVWRRVWSVLIVGAFKNLEVEVLAAVDKLHGHVIPKRFPYSLFTYFYH